ncbi:hypothetical protein F511_37088 [Dorcoceras hygrometricum]|uniref:Uncharacterized protein n=1 Tax=Dorcoceras hygrometricum TaxID=472368 RepID=A0A2Z7CLS0_9LAMI|nr:hypothetical protein F511_37088 [Dorcoceras hygrometricum]
MIHCIKQEEWVVCRVFQKSLIVKKPQQTASSPQSKESPSDTNAMVNELQDMEYFQNFSNTMPIISPSANIATQGCNNDNIANWGAAANSLQSLTNWPLLSTNLSMNSLFLTALQLRGCGHSPPTGAAMGAMEGYSLMPQGSSSPFGNDFGATFGMGSSSSRLLGDDQPPARRSNPITWTPTFGDDCSSKASIVLVN